MYIRVAYFKLEITQLSKHFNIKSFETKKKDKEVAKYKSTTVLGLI